MNKYEDIINLSRPISKNHPPMSLNNRSAQFAPFSALTGYSEKIKEVARTTNPKIELSDEEKLKINDKINWVKENIKEKPKITITYFVQDKKKSGGQYRTRRCVIRRVDEVYQKLILPDKTYILIENILDIHIDKECML